MNKDIRGERMQGPEVDHDADTLVPGMEDAETVLVDPDAETVKMESGEDAPTMVEGGRERFEDISAEQLGDVVREVVARELRERVEAGREGLKNDAERAREAVNNAVDSAIETGVMTAEAIETSIKQVEEDVRAEINSRIAEAKEGAAADVENLKASVDRGFSRLIGKGVMKGAELVESGVNKAEETEQRIEAAKAEAGATFTEFMNLVGETIKEVEDTVQATREQVEATGTAILGVAAEMDKAAAGKVSDLREKAKEASAAANRDGIRFERDVRNAVNDTARGLMGRVSGVLLGWSQKINSKRWDMMKENGQQNERLQNLLELQG